MTKLPDYDSSRFLRQTLSRELIHKFFTGKKQPLIYTRTRVVFGIADNGKTGSTDIPVCDSYFTFTNIRKPF
jgi:hypothetical protein